jgi:hypothetical protein
MMNVSLTFEICIVDIVPTSAFLKKYSKRQSEKNVTSGALFQIHVGISFPQHSFQSPSVSVNQRFLGISPC